MRRLGAVGLVSVLAASGCGSGGKDLSHKLKDRFAREHVTLVNYGLGGDQYASVDVLAPVPRASPFGDFTIEVPRDGGVAKLMRGARRGAGGVFWARTDLGYRGIVWAAKQPYGDKAVLTWQAGAHPVTDGRFDRLVAIVRGVVGG